MQFRYLARLAAWPSGTTSVVVGSSAYATAGPLTEARLGRQPWLAVNLGQTSADPEVPSLVDTEILATLGVCVQGDVMGEQALVGGPRSGGIGSSQGRGILEIEAPLLAAVGAMTGADGLPIVCSFASSPHPSPYDEQAGPSYILKEYAFKIRCTTTDEYPAPHEFTATGGAGSATLAWTLPAARFDRRQIVLVYAAGATPPTSASGGTPITLATDLATSKTAVLAAGTYSFALFCGYNPTGAASNENYSAQDVGSYRASVVVT